MFTSEEAAFIDRIREDHGDDLPRLIYADWLDDRGDHPKADFIRVQCALARLEMGDANGIALREFETHLSDSHASKWAKEIRQVTEGFAFRRGLIEAVTVTPRQYLALGEKGLARYPITRVRFTNLPDAARLAPSPLMRFITELDLSGSSANAGGGVTIARSRYLRNLKQLDLGFTEIDRTALAMIVQTPAMSGLRTLRLNGNLTLTSDAIRAVFTSQYLTDLETIDLSDNRLPIRVLDQLLYSFESLPKLRNVLLSGNRLGDRMPDLIVSPMWAKLLTKQPELDFSDNGIRATALELMVESPAFNAVRSLTLDQNPLGDAGVAAIIRSANTAGLERVSLEKCGVSDDGVRELANSPLMGQLTELNLRENIITQEAIERLRTMSRRKMTGEVLKLNVDAQLPNSRPSAIHALRPFIPRNV